MRQARDDGALLALGKQLRGAQGRVGRLKRRAGKDAQTWQRWSTVIEETLALVSQISRTPASDLQGVSVKLDALVWLLTHDDSILDIRAGRQLQALGREVRMLAKR